MDWVPNSDPFVAPLRLRHFTCGSPTGGSCHVLSSYEYAADKNSLLDDGKPVIHRLSSQSDWENWLKVVDAIPEDGNLSSQSLHRNGYCILFIPAPAKIKIKAGPSPRTSHRNYTALPLISNANWQKVATAFRLPGHYDRVVTRNVTSVTSVPRTYSFNDNFKEKLWMHVAMTRPRYSLPGYHAFALAATHFQTQNATFAIMVGCSEDQIDKIESLVRGWGDAVGHPLLMLGICAELHLDRLEELTIKQDIIYQNLLSRVKDNATSDSNDKFSWELIEEVRHAREEAKRVEVEVDTTKLQLSNAVTSSVSKLLAQYKTLYNDSTERINIMAADPKGKSPAHSSMSSNCSDTGSTITKLQRELELKIETTHLFEERFNDILSRLDGLSAQCRISVEGISFTTDIIRSELARQEAQLGRKDALISAKNTKLGVAISLIALTYLPLTAVASIMDMPIFQWNNDWRDWRYRPVGRGNSSTTGTDSQTRLPVVSGYIAIYFPIAIGLVIVTLTLFARYYYQLDDNLLLSTNSQGNDRNGAQARKQRFTTTFSGIFRRFLGRSGQPSPRPSSNSISVALSSSCPWLRDLVTAVRCQLLRLKDKLPLYRQKSSTPSSQQTASSILQQLPSTSQQHPRPPQQQSSLQPQGNPRTTERSDKTLKASSGGVKSDLELKAMSSERSITHASREIPSISIAPEELQGTSEHNSLHSATDRNIGTAGPATSDAGEEERTILLGTPSHRLV
ncbi:hypothetical protein F5Y01DRAFT_324285 [Xylaria sp. FL0043]|nr:hypothetical protein F5Y01DRAFT_324285 [Xylaria sp. FL0043]